MKKRWLVVFSIICLLFAAVFTGCGESAPLEAYTVTVIANKSSYGTVSVSKLRNVDSGTAIVVSENKLTIGETEIIAVPVEDTKQYDFAFVDWDCKGASTVTKDLTIVANFTREQRQYTVSILSGNTAYGTVDVERVVVPYGTEITAVGNQLTIGEAVVTATPVTPDETYTYEFVAWDTKLLVTGDLTATATFKATENWTATEAQALSVLATSENHYWYYFHGAAQAFAVEKDTLTWTVGQNANGAYGGGVGATLLPATVQAIYDLGFKRYTFTLGIESGLYCAIYIDDETGLEYLSGTAVAKDENNYYFFENGAEITIDLEALVGNSEFMNTACAVDKGGLHFVVLTAPEFTIATLYKSQTTITMSGSSFAEFSDGELLAQAVDKAILVLSTTANHFPYYYHGAIQGIVANGTTLTWKVGQSGNAAGVGTTLYPSIIKALYNLGFKKLTFTLGIEKGLYCAIYIDNDTGLDYISGDGSKDANNYYYYRNGTEITIDLEALVNDTAFMSATCDVAGGGLHFVITAGAEFATGTIYTSRTTIVLSEIKFQ